MCALSSRILSDDDRKSRPGEIESSEPGTTEFLVTTSKTIDASNCSSSSIANVLQRNSIEQTEVGRLSIFEATKFKFSGHGVPIVDQTQPRCLFTRGTAPCTWCLVASVPLCHW